MEVKRTISTIFMVPTLKINKDDLKANGFINAYAWDKRLDVQHKNAVYLLFKPKDFDKFRQFLDNEGVRKQGIIDDYDYEDGYVVVVYKLNTKWKEDFMLIKEGLYSRTSKDFQKLFPEIIDLPGKKDTKVLSLQHRIFKKSQELRDYWQDKIDVEFTDEMEVWDGFIIENETLDLEKLKQEEEVI